MNLEIRIKDERQYIYRERVEKDKRLLTRINDSGESIGQELILSQSELFRFIPISVSKPMRIIPNQSEKRFVTRLMKNSKRTIRPNPI